MLQALNCEYGQGHFFSKALTGEWEASLLFANASIGLAQAGLQKLDACADFARDSVSKSLRCGAKQ